MTHTNDDLAEKLNELLIRLSELESINEKQTGQIQELIQAWSTAKGIVAIIRWLAAVGAGLTAAWGAAKGVKIL